jgi:hypothetical protein
VKITITAHEVAHGPTGFPGVVYDIETDIDPIYAPTVYAAATANDALVILDEVGLTPNQARRALHDARDIAGRPFEPDLYALGVET